MLLRNKRAWLADCLNGLGLVRLIERYARRPGLVTLVYHRIGEPETDPFYRPLISATPAVFETQMKCLRASFRVIRLEELESGGLLDESGRLRVLEPTALITFDDGYRDNLTLAAPILKSLQLPAALFVTTGFVGEHRSLPWWDRVAYAVQASPRAEITLDQPIAATLTLEGDRSGAVQHVIAAFIARGWAADEAELSHLEERAGMDLEQRRARAARLFLDRRELRELESFGFSIGAHTQTHRRLAGLDEPALELELAGARAELETWLQRAPASVAYPYGGADAFDQQTTVAAARAGYALGFALDPRQARPGAVDRWALPRFAVGSADTAGLLRARLALACRLSRSPL